MRSRSRESAAQGHLATTSSLWYPLMPPKTELRFWRINWRFTLRDYLWAMALISCFVAIYVQAARYSSAFSLYEQGNLDGVRFTAIDIAEESASYLALVGKNADLDIKLTSHDGQTLDVVERMRLLPGRHVISCRVIRRNNNLVLECIAGHQFQSVSLDVRNATQRSIALSEPSTKNWTNKTQTVARIDVEQPSGNQTMSIEISYIARKSSEREQQKHARELERQSWRNFLESIPPAPDYNHH